MTKIRLTQTYVDNATCPAGKQKTDHFDTAVSGFLLKVMPTGKRTFYLRYKDSHGKVKEKALLDARVVSLADARHQAKIFLSELALGNDPFVTQQTKRATPTLKDFYTVHYLPYMKAHKPKSWKTDEAAMRLHVLPTLGKCYLDEIKRRDIQDLVTAHSRQHKPSSTNRMLNVLHRLFACALDWEITGISRNPVSGVSKLRENNQRQRYLSKDELRSLWHELETSEFTYVTALLKMLLLTGARKSEAAHAKWGDIDLQGNQWCIPEDKTGSARYVPLSNVAIDMLRQLERLEGCDYLFPNPATMQPYNNIFHTWRNIRNAADISDIRIHDLRHSYASFLVNQGTPIYEVAQILGHSKLSTTQRYAHLSQDKLLASTNVVGDLILDAIAINPNHAIQNDSNLLLPHSA